MAFKFVRKMKHDVQTLPCYVKFVNNVANRKIGCHQNASVCTTLASFFFFGTFWVKFAINLRYLHLSAAHVGTEFLTLH